MKVTTHTYLAGELVFFEKEEHLDPVPICIIDLRDGVAAWKFDKDVTDLTHRQIEYICRTLGGVVNALRESGTITERDKERRDDF